MAAGVAGSNSSGSIRIDQERVPMECLTVDLTCNEEFHVPPTPEDEKSIKKKCENADQEDLSCNIPPVKAFRDLTLVQDDRILQNLLRMESRSLPQAPDYFRFVQREIKPSMRKIVADWMLQVCQELQCQPEVFALAMNYLDRFLARCRVRKGSLQLLGSVCLLVASKFKETCPILGERLIFYSDFSIRSDELKDWELFLLQELRWELSAVTPLDFLDHLLDRLRLDPRLVDREDVRRRSETVLVLAATEYQFCYLNPSLLAASALHAVIHNLLEALIPSVTGVVTPDCLNRLRTDLKGLLGNLQVLSHSPSYEIQLCSKQLALSSPSYLTQFNAVDMQHQQQQQQQQQQHFETPSSLASPSPSPPAISPSSSTSTLVSSTTTLDLQVLTPPVQDQQHQSHQSQDQHQQQQNQDSLNQSGLSILVS